MFSFLKKKKEIVPVNTGIETIKSNTFGKNITVKAEEIHLDFDKSTEYILNEAKDVLSKIEKSEKAEVLKSLGFTNAQSVVDSVKQQSLEDFSNLVLRYSVEYPLQKFITEEALNNICRKYGLIYAPVSNYIGDVPTKNIIEIKNAKPLSYQDTVSTKYYFKVANNSRIKYGEWAKDFIQLPMPFTNDVIRKFNYMNEEFVRKLGYKGEIPEHIILSSFEIKTVIFDGLFIAATRDCFKIDNLETLEEFGFFEEKRFIINDPIVFRYCKGGVQIISKWGDEASDESLINEINN